MGKKKTKQWVSATIQRDNYNAVRQKALELYGGNFSQALDHIISIYRSIWTDLMMKRLMAEVYDAYDKVREERCNG